MAKVTCRGSQTESLFVVKLNFKGLKCVRDVCVKQNPEDPAAAAPPPPTKNREAHAQLWEAGQQSSVCFIAVMLFSKIKSGWAKNF